MDYSELNGLLTNLEVKQENKDKLKYSSELPTRLNSNDFLNDRNNFSYLHQKDYNQRDSLQFSERNMPKTDYVNPFINENTFFNDSQQFSIRRKDLNNPQTTYENISVDRNNDYINSSNLDTNFIYERFEPENDNISKSQITDSKRLCYEMNRHMHTNDISQYRHKDVNVFDYGQFSETYKNINNLDERKSSEINNKLSKRDNIPDISTMPIKSWEN